jgi:alpha-ketoglutarate-dependent taurine dioxygenase
MLRAIASHVATPAPAVAAQSSERGFKVETLSADVAWGAIVRSSASAAALVLDPAQAQLLRAALLEHGVLVFRPATIEQGRLSPAELTAFMVGMSPVAHHSPALAAERMKSYEATPCQPADDTSADPASLSCPKAHVPGYPSVRHLGSTRDGASGAASSLLCRTGYEWHTDNIGPTYTALHCAGPALARGGETLFASAQRMYEVLGTEAQTELESLEAWHSNRYTSGGPSAFDCHHGLRMNATGTAVLQPASTQRPSWTLSEAKGPLVERHSVTNRPYLVAVPKNLDRIEGYSPEASRQKLHSLLLPGLGGLPAVDKMGQIDPQSGLTVSETHFSPHFVHKHKWRQGDVVIWDNEHIVHTTTPVSEYSGEVERDMWQLIQDVGPDDGSAAVNPEASRNSGTSHQRFRGKLQGQGDGLMPRRRRDE